MNGYKTKDYGQPVKRYVQMMDLHNNPDLIARYREAHSREGAWQEILDGIRSVGILEMEIYILENHLVMIVDTPLDFEWSTAMQRLATLPRQQEWEAYVAQFQQCDATATSDEKWHMAERMFHLYEKQHTHPPERQKHHTARADKSTDMTANLSVFPVSA